MSTASAAAPTPAPAAAHKAAHASRHAASARPHDEGAANAGYFGHVLDAQSLLEAQTLVETEEASALISDTHQPTQHEAVLDAQFQSGFIDASTASAADLAGTLLGQTRRMDQSADLRALNPDALAAHGTDTLHAGQAPTAVGSTIATVAAGVQLEPDAAAAAQLTAHTAQLSTAEQLASRTASAAALQAGLEAARQSKLDTADTSGRIALDANWQLSPTAHDTQPSSEHMQRLITQVGQWVAAHTGRTPRTGHSGISDEVEPHTTPSAALEQLAATGSGLRTLEQSIAQLSASADTRSPQPDAQQQPMHDMRFWLQGKHQRAELTIAGGDTNATAPSAVRVQVTLNGDEAHIRFASAETHTRAALDSSQQQLRDMLQQQGLELASLQVDEAPPQGSSSATGGQSSGSFSEQTHSTEQPMRLILQRSGRRARIAAPMHEGASLGTPAPIAPQRRGLNVYV